MNYRALRIEYRIMFAMFMVAFPIALVVYAFSGCDLRRRGDKHACRDGSAEKCLAVGQFYEGRSSGFFSTMLSNPTTAINYYQRACKLGNTTGCARFGHMKVVGHYDTIKDDDFTQDDGLAALGKACDGGVTDACHELAGALDPARAAPVLDKLCKGGDKATCAAFAAAVAATDPKAGLELAVKQCEAGDNNQCGAVSAGLLVGSGEEPARGVALLTKACDRGAIEECTQLAEAYTNGTLPADPARAAELFANACAHDDDDACFEQAKGLIDSDPGKSLQVLTASCEKKSDLRACDAIGDMWRVGTAATPADSKQALAMYDRTCRGGNDFSCYKRDCMKSPDNSSDACGKVFRTQKSFKFKLGGKFHMR
jgi:TPR repeat protein